MVRLLRAVLAVALSVPVVAVSAPASAAVTAEWCWSMQSGTLKGTFTTDGTMPGDGTAASGTYNLTGFTVYESAFPDIEVGSIADGTYAFGSQPQYQIIWNGSTVTGFYRSSGAQTNGFGIQNGPGSNGAYIIFNINYQSADTTGAGGVNIFTSSVTPSLEPVPASGDCAGEITTSEGGQTPPDILEQYGRAIDESCRDGWGPSWAQWPNAQTGGWVCTRTLFYSNASRSWQVR